MNWKNGFDNNNGARHGLSREKRTRKKRGVWNFANPLDRRHFLHEYKAQNPAAGIGDIHNMRDDEVELVLKGLIEPKGTFKYKDVNVKRSTITIEGVSADPTLVDAVEGINQQKAYTHICNGEVSNIIEATMDDNGNITILNPLEDDPSERDK